LSQRVDGSTAAVFNSLAGEAALAPEVPLLLVLLLMMLALLWTLLVVQLMLPAV